MTVASITVPIGSIADVARGGSPRPIKRFITDDADGVNWIKIGDAEKGAKFITSTQQKIVREGIKSSRWVDEGDFLLSNSMSFGRPYILKTSGCIHDGWLVLKPDYSRVDQGFLYYALSSPEVFRQFDSLAAGSTVRNLNIRLVSSVTIPLPPLDEQKRIVAVLDQAFAALDRARAHAEANVNDQAELIDSTIRRELFGSASLNWREQRFDDFSVLKRGYDLPSKDRTSGKYALVTSSGVTDSHDKMKVSGPGVATGRSGSIGNVYYVPGDFWPLNTALYVRDFKGNDPRFVWYFLRGFDLSRFSTGAGVPTLNRNHVHGELVRVPDCIVEQAALARKLDHLCETAEILEEVYEAKVTDIADLRQSILQKAFAGQLA